MFDPVYGYGSASSIIGKYFGRSSEKPVRHQQACPVCGRTLVNTYKHNGIWKCRRYWEEATP